MNPQGKVLEEVKEIIDQFSIDRSMGMPGVIGLFVKKCHDDQLGNDYTQTSGLSIADTIAIMNMQLLVCILEKLNEKETENAAV